jgi:hypothetical protein
MNWDAFISHASEDKEDFVRALAAKLREEGLRIWYDEFTLTVGDSLRRSIDRGLANSRFGIVVISRSFLQKEWPQKELDGLVAREIGGVKVILPVWHNISAAEVLSYSPLLADRLAASSNEGLEQVAKKLFEAMRLAMPEDRVDPDPFLATEDPADDQVRAPLTPETALHKAKRFIADPRFEIALHDFIGECSQRSFVQLEENKVLNGEGPFSKDEFQRRLGVFEEGSSISTALFALASYWDCRNRGFDIAFGRYLSLALTPGAGHVYCHQLKWYPALANFYAAGITGLLSNHLTLFGKMLDALTTETLRLSGSPPADLLWGYSPFNSLTSSLGTQGVFDWLGVNSHSAGSERLLSFISPLLREYVPNEVVLLNTFDKFEYLISLIHADFRIRYENDTGRRLILWIPPGSYIYRGRSHYGQGLYLGDSRFGASNVVTLLNRELEEKGSEWGPLKAGVFGGSIERARAAVEFAKSFFVEHKISF